MTINKKTAAWGQRFSDRFPGLSTCHPYAGMIQIRFIGYDLRPKTATPADDAIWMEG